MVGPDDLWGLFFHVEEMLLTVPHAISGQCSERAGKGQPETCLLA